MVQKTSTVRHTSEYNQLSNVIRETVSADGHDLVTVTTRDGDENAVRTVEPLGNVTKYAYDERNLLLEQWRGPGTIVETVVQYTYTSLGRRSVTDGRGNRTHYEFDGFHRYRGFSNAAGTTRKQRYDAAGNVTHIEVTGDIAPMSAMGSANAVQTGSLLETWHHYDELNRRFRTDRAWRP